MLAQVRTHYLTPQTFIPHDSHFSPNILENSASTPLRTISHHLPSPTAPALLTSLPLLPQSILSPPQSTQQVGLVNSGSIASICSPPPEPEATTPFGSLDGDPNSDRTARPPRRDVYDIATAGDLGDKSGSNSSGGDGLKRSHGEADDRPDAESVGLHNNTTHTAEDGLGDESIVLTTLKDRKSKRTKGPTMLRRSKRTKTCS